MNIHAYTLDSLRRLVRALLKENRELKQKLNITPREIEAFFTDATSFSEYDEDQGSRIESRYITDQMARDFFALFHGRHDVFALRWKNGRYFPRLDTLMMAMPISDGGILEQYVGRLNRDYPDKQNVVVYDYIDSHLRVFDNMYNKRLKTYKKIGFDIITNAVVEKQNANSIYNSSNYIDTFEKDIIEANKSVIVSSEELLQSKVERFISLVSSRIESGVNISVVLAPAEISCNGDDLFFNEMIGKLKATGINVFVSNNSVERFAIMDDEIVWHGSVNFFGKEDYKDNLLRVISPSTAAELKEITFA